MLSSARKVFLFLLLVPHLLFSRVDNLFLGVNFKFRLSSFPTTAPFQVRTFLSDDSLKIEKKQLHIILIVTSF